MCMRAMYQKCKLVHGDLSEYNMLHFRGTLYIIDVSQVRHPLGIQTRVKSLNNKKVKNKKIENRK